VYIPDMKFSLQTLSNLSCLFGLLVSVVYSAAVEGAGSIEAYEEARLEKWAVSFFEADNDWTPYDFFEDPLNNNEPPGRHSEGAPSIASNLAALQNDGFNEESDDNDSASDEERLPRFLRQQPTKEQSIQKDDLHSTNQESDKHTTPFNVQTPVKSFAFDHCGLSNNNNNNNNNDDEDEDDEIQDLLNSLEKHFLGG